MKYKNSFFQVVIKTDGTYLDIYPPVSDGKRLDAKEIVDFLEEKGCHITNMGDIKNALADLADQKIRIKLGPMPIHPFDESVKITISPDKMVAYARFYPPSQGGKLMTKREIIAELEREKITVGISDKIISVFLQARQYCLNIPVAKGEKPIPAKDTIIEYFFDTKPLAKPKMLDDGSVDFHSLSLFTSVKKGDVLARLTPHEMGVNGRDLFGKTVFSTKPKVKTLKYGKNIAISEDKCVLTSEVDGDVTLAGDTVFVSNTYNVAADVDASTGDIDYEGNVMIPGNVRTGFTVKAKGDIQVNGVVEGATLIAGGNIVIKRGVQGMGKGVLKANGDICAQFFESANVKVKGNVISGSILHSSIMAGEKVLVRGRKGFIVGGEIICDNYIEASSIGNRMETRTILSVAVKPELYEELKELSARAAELNESMKETASYLNVFETKKKKGMELTPENLKQIKLYSSQYREYEKEYNEKAERMREIREMLEYSNKGTIRVLGTSYRGVDIHISMHSYSVKDDINHCLYRIAEGAIKPVGI